MAQTPLRRFPDPPVKFHPTPPRHRSTIRPDLHPPKTHPDCRSFEPPIRSDVGPGQSSTIDYIDNPSSSDLTIPISTIPWSSSSSSSSSDGGRWMVCRLLERGVVVHRRLYLIPRREEGSREVTRNSTESPERGWGR